MLYFMNWIPSANSIKHYRSHLKTLQCIMNAARCRNPICVVAKRSYLIANLLNPPFSHPKNLSTHDLFLLYSFSSNFASLPGFFFLDLLAILAFILWHIRYVLTKKESYCLSA